MDPTSGLGVYAKQLGVSVVLGPTWRFMGNYKSGYKWGIYIYIYIFITHIRGLVITPLMTTHEPPSGSKVS